ncbi:5'-methylthioadenosine/S-adenosylhomocysteine nucleosidase family protein [Nocardiopsis halophila]|uniref:5'-methylthioadenosine/S-adenosylhomocysteine nucleosidase family protein n=1 Tax=Nocardiopsis halophila TaxID=141692 RepID=UPI000347D26E|nr:5'-methylthioadenosine/S-adenosylhomocysteine nucleosidase [Nocardiopsis halophila]
MTDGLVVVLTAFNLEYEAVRRRLVDPRLHRHEKGTRFEVGGLPRKPGRVALGLTGKGNHPAAVLAERAMQRFSPDALLFVGVAGALWDATPLGDVVMATQVYAYHGGTSEDDGLMARPRAWEAPHEISQIGSHLARTGAWRDAPGPGERTPNVHFAPIAAGEIVQNSRISREAQWIREKYNDALAIEMEAAGVAQAGHLNGAPVAIVRGISDRADGGKTTDDDRTWQPGAAANAAAFAIGLAEELIENREHTAMQSETPFRNGTTVNNNSSGTVGIQAGTVSGTTHVYMAAAAPEHGAPDLAARLSAVRGRLADQRAAGALDTATHGAADAELDLADRALRDGEPSGNGPVLLPLKRLRGLVGGVADLETSVDELIAAARGTA